MPRRSFTGALEAFVKVLPLGGEQIRVGCDDNNEQVWFALGSHTVRVLSR
jgi:hypothetical protein